MRSLFSGEICVAADKFKFAFERSFKILFSRVLLLGVEFSANFAAKILWGRILSFRICAQSAFRGLVKTLQSKILLSRILSSEALPRKILLGRNSLLVASSRKILHPWIYERKISARKISFFEILQTLPFKISQALFYRESTAPRLFGALNFASQNPLVALTNVASENSCAMQAVKFIKFTGSESSSEAASSLALTAAADRTQAASFTAANFAAIKTVKTRPVAIKAIIAKVVNALNLASSRVFARLKNGSDLKEASRAH
ncbi:hypothetical protein [Campylobacter gracilis]|uniref:Uncharacterized protein n=1 Tax=Campylobacter gracilis RM3268 TaxID=553220 RepID=C8PI12_9BACT|nr:hypothetical protein [Campylobacter gracilis]AKT93175.1 hypothetical protein CGRAC_1760 [Campylobacter gracilis]EEV17776.1 hypothetical protein CAMGR0001_0608 [Campylobacter gracilis RM3268]UEB44655.1 hypothetical protein LK410_06410 [Campylobacter gracilis]SUW78493.1 Uncharacterised protein [Campylobacter gracilis]